MDRPLMDSPYLQFAIPIFPAFSCTFPPKQSLLLFACSLLFAGCHDPEYAQNMTASFEVFLTQEAFHPPQTAVQKLEWFLLTGNRNGNAHFMDINLA